MEVNPCLAWEQHPRDVLGDGNLHSAKFRVSFAVCRRICASPCPGNAGAAEH